MKKILKAKIPKAGLQIYSKQPLLPSSWSRIDLANQPQYPFQLILDSGSKLFLEQGPRY